MTTFGTYDNYCLQKRRFCDISSDGTVYPCSFIREPMGNILKENFKDIWKKRGDQIECPYKCMGGKNEK